MFQSVVHLIDFSTSLKEKIVIFINCKQLFIVINT